MEKFDFSKIEDQKKFDNLPGRERDQIVDEGREEAVEMAGKIKFEIKDKLSLSDELRMSQENQRVIIEKIIEDLKKGNIVFWTEIEKGSPLLDELFLNPEVQESAKEAFIEFLSNCNIDSAIKIKDKLNLQEEVIRQSVIEGFINCLSGGLKNSDNEGGDYSALEILERFDISMSAKTMRKAVKQAMFRSLSFNLVDNFIELNQRFSVNIISQEIIDEVPELNNLLIKIKNISPELYNQILRSTDTAISLLELKDNQDRFFDIIESNPFLLNALSENTRFSLKLLLKFPQLDELSQQNIEFLFSAKKEILAENPQIVPESPEFRQLMQEKLKNYESNLKILAKMEKSGINVEKWLNYQDTRYFSLESGKSDLPFSETVSAPLDRIKETINSYSHQIKEVLKEYKKELSGYQIPVENPQEIEEKIAQMREEQENAMAEGNEKKAQGIQKGIDGLSQKLTNIKTVSSWDKILGDINAFDQLKTDVFGIQEKLIQSENEFAEKISGKTPSGKEIQDAKQRIARAKEELRNKFGLLENRIENFKINLPKSTEPVLGKERTEALIQEIETGLAEEFDHYNADRSTLANLFSERGDKEKDKMDSLPMSVFVWARNPDIDLYQGNYSDCCIKINSEHMGAESTIADYNTDLGVQIVNIWDETKNEPITAAWCWLGKNEKGETSLVLDNIESNTLYSSNYPEQLTEELFDYLKDYAKAIGVKKIVLGKANNDLPTGGELAKFNDDDGRYEKIGGYNRTDGYFLEAEDKSVKVIWEAKQKESRGKTKEKSETTTVEFTEISAKDLKENDFEMIKRMEKKVYRDTDFIQGQAMIEDIKTDKGLDYSIIFYGKNANTGKTEAVGYVVAVEGKTDEGDPCVYLEDIALLPKAQGQRLGLNMLKVFAEKLKVKALKENKPILLDMHLRENSQRFIGRNRQALEQIGMKLIEEALVVDYYDEGEDALYQVYEIKGE